VIDSKRTLMPLSVRGVGQMSVGSGTLQGSEEAGESPDSIHERPRNRLAGHLARRRRLTGQAY